jgi:V/A-type H+-transporting ATPase subunit A
MGGIFDGIQRPLNVLCDMVGAYIARGVDVPGLIGVKKWHFVPSVKDGAEVVAGDVLGTVAETPLVQHKD